MLIELCFGYPDAVLNAVGHPVTWIGRLIDALEKWLNRDTAGSRERRSAGVVAVLILVAVVGAVTLVIEYGLLRLPLGIFVASLLASTLVAQRSLNRHVAEVRRESAEVTSVRRSAPWSVSATPRVRV